MKIMKRVWNSWKVKGFLYLPVLADRQWTREHTFVRLTFHCSSLSIGSDSMTSSTFLSSALHMNTRYLPCWQTSLSLNSLTGKNVNIHSGPLDWERHILLQCHDTKTLRITLLNRTSKLLFFIIYYQHGNVKHDSPWPWSANHKKNTACILENDLIIVIIIAMQPKVLNI